MKKITFTLAICLIGLIGFAQQKPKVEAAKQDTTISIIMSIHQYRALLNEIDKNVDSKKLSKELLEFLQRSAQIVQPIDKPKQK